ncbi:hypothetical protein E3T39_06100 [Cryobacterium suzukii]|uniref:DUF600 family protein n=1 Tax=Cryobacterium suzukii TaxID=1259198 RepID=A0A4R9AHB0_9MICO|nr:hypothetical protein [Cryobacterium suzukii]TFD61610.1 hypothetical protein E3T39_06100 [Cryobacterium suzukii]
MSDLTGLVPEREAFEAVARILLGMMVEGDERIEYNASVTDPVSRSDVKAFNPNGEFEEAEGRVNGPDEPDELFGALEALRLACYRPGAGTWFSIRVVVQAAGAATVEYNYDNEADFGMGGIDPVGYVVDEEKFPRDEDKQPEWLKLRLAEGRALLAERGQSQP